MGMSEKEYAELKLPAAAVPQVKKALRDAVNKHLDQVLAECKRFWIEEAKRTRSTKKYREALDRWDEAYWNSNRWSYGRYSAPAVSEQVHQDVHKILQDLAGKPRQVQIKDLPEAKATNKTVTFHMGGDGSVTIKGRTLIYSTDYYKNTVERCRGHVVGQALFSVLESINWTRGTGGVVTYTNENYREDMSANAQPNTINKCYGPLGEREYEWVHGFNPRTHKPARRLSYR